MCVSTRYSPLIGTVFSQRKQEKNIFRVDNQRENNISKEESNMVQENEISKYLKQKESNVSKSNRKSKHKHQYEECLIQYNLNHINKDTIITSLQSYCTICGKIGDRFKEDKSIVKDYRRTVDTPIGKCYSLISGEELYKKYHDKIPVFFVEDIYRQKYIDLEQNSKLDGE